jgi:hypothetical protein
LGALEAMMERLLMDALVLPKSRTLVNPRLAPADVGLTATRYEELLEDWFGRTPPSSEPYDCFDLAPYCSEVQWEGSKHHAEWIAFTILVFARASVDLLPRDRRAVEIGLSAYVTPVPAEYSVGFRHVDRSTALAYLWALERLWLDYFLVTLDEPAYVPGTGSQSALVGLAFMWFDNWIPPQVVAQDVECRSALWQLLSALLDSGNVVCEAAAWHGINHLLDDYLDGERTDRLHAGPVGAALARCLERWGSDHPVFRYALRVAGSGVL